MILKWAVKSYIVEDLIKIRIAMPTDGYNKTLTDSFTCLNSDHLINSCLTRYLFVRYLIKHTF